ncbi:MULTISPECIES: aldose 1-epimerase family protein [unclassified Crossiella]|uniref:aldose 1-epimerase family protein n=1 Tax=unclassified Crossiella TaxID=2620835 RepID=UPI001FFE91C3|nr:MULTISPECIES: aldose 1-epimerase family protein [unclassified Crossiella]MCK2238003.1 aldose 1-epimerase family protein [Crossiella sp. S99.2]MCK2255286.1 aldose 1-epimerase family protein [Crossiella sp. S99.1]
MTVNGEQYEITDGPVRAVINEVGAAPRILEIGGLPYLETYPDEHTPPMGCGAVLVPWPNRVGGGRWTHAGQTQQLALTEPARGNASHGLLRYTSWQPEARSAAEITLGADVNVQPGWPVRLRATVTYRVHAEGLTVTHTVANRGHREIPFGVGAHPYPRAAAAATDDCTLELAATTAVELDPERKIPTGAPAPIAGTDLDFRTARPLRGVELDTAFGGCLPGADGLVHHVLRGPGGGVELWADPVFSWVQVYTPDGFPDRGRAVAIEPMTCPPDALNNGLDLITLEPGQTWSGSWGIRAVG